MSRLFSVFLAIYHVVGKYKYLIAVSVFLLIFVFLDENCLIRRFQHKQEIRALNEEIEKYRGIYLRDTERLDQLETNPEAIEKIAREKYLMKTVNEDIYIIEGEE